MLKTGIGVFRSIASSGDDNYGRAQFFNRELALQFQRGRQLARRLHLLVRFWIFLFIITGDYVYDLLEGNEQPAEAPLDAASEALLRDTR
ncbi:hypothetical protein [Hyphomonas johnsonii]|uniref:Uncharacterized protein n=1 Tax=Hyphomonas johnsonii MHS-2 TaxID=1280950 RepID=A0A059FPW6_9PROT|nr:hypothetical protein [Hyphomonas johnsonii]KCZ92704.1 hypothetical protein HJO_07112 [Hyphomonas johnsonii MHS-2]